MILVTLGTQDKSFVRLLKAIEKAIKDGIIKDEVIVQAGYTRYQSDVMEIFDSIERDKFEKLMEQADLVITHSGVGSILTALKYNKKVIAAPRLSKYKEHTNDHQKQIMNEFAKQGFLLPLKDFSKLDKVLEKAKTFKPKKYQSHNEEFVTMIDQYIEKQDHISWYHRDRKIIFIGILNIICFCLLTYGKVNSFLALSISYAFSAGIAVVLKIKRQKNDIIIFFFFYMLEILLLLLLSTHLSLPLFLAKIIINFILVIMYHIIDKRNDRKAKISL